VLSGNREGELPDALRGQTVGGNAASRRIYRTACLEGCMKRWGPVRFNRDYFGSTGVPRCYATDQATAADSDEQSVDIGGIGFQLEPLQFPGRARSRPDRRRECPIRRSPGRFARLQPRHRHSVHFDDQGRSIATSSLHLGRGRDAWNEDGRWDAEPLSRKSHRRAVIVLRGERGPPCNPILEELIVHQNGLASPNDRSHCCQ
jgi:hypothetical protein